MTKSKKVLVWLLIMLAVAGVGSYFKNQLRAILVSTPVTGTWTIAGNDYMFDELTFEADGKFTEESYFLETPEKVSKQSGKWEIVKKNDEKYIKLTYDKEIWIPLEIELKRLAEKDQEFIGNNQTTIKINTDKAGRKYLWFYLNRLEKTDSR